MPSFFLKCPRGNLNYTIFNELTFDNVLGEGSFGCRSTLACVSVILDEPFYSGQHRCPPYFAGAVHKHNVSISDIPHNPTTTDMINRERAIKPLGCTDSSAITTAGKAAASKEMEEEMRQKMAWRLVQQQAGGLPQQMFMMWMSGSQVHIFSIMMVVFSCRTPVMSFLNMSTNFARIEDKEMESQFVWQKVAYLGCNLAAACLSMYQLQRLGLLPTSDSDWLEFYEQSEPMEYSAGSLSL